MNVFFSWLDYKPTDLPMYIKRILGNDKKIGISKISKTKNLKPKTSVLFCLLLTISVEMKLLIWNFYIPNWIGCVDKKQNYVRYKYLWYKIDLCFLNDY